MIPMKPSNRWRKTSISKNCCYAPMDMWGVKSEHILFIEVKRMTEKRFVYMNLLETEAISVSDDECYYFNEYGSVEKVCDLLNALHKENEQLKQEVREYIKALNKTLEEREELWEENEQLKQRNKRLEEKIQRERRVYAKQHLKWSKEAETKIKELSGENEQLKKELLFFYDIANCECSTNWKGDMEKGCKRFFNCTYEEAKEKYGDYDGMWWEIND